MDPRGSRNSQRFGRGSNQTEFLIIRVRQCGGASLFLPELTRPAGLSVIATSLFDPHLVTISAQGRGYSVYGRGGAVAADGSGDVAKSVGCRSLRKVGRRI